MRVLVFSDSHGRVGPMVDAVELYRPDVAFHLGDVTRDGDNLRLAHPALTLYQVSGNCDWSGSDYPAEGVVRLAGKTILYLHGHTVGVKTGTAQAVARARSLGADILLFGHTHCPYQARFGDLLAVNPGAAADGRCALLTWEAGDPVEVLPLER